MVLGPPACCFACAPLFQRISRPLFELRLRSWEVHFEHVNRDFNRAADFLAKWGAKDHKDYVEWLEPGNIFTMSFFLI
ncbi:hypothetical protein PIB30_043624 [Stylosanthes scabra]|uniref:RNase H type-1 domain-containing protein n=1 Tax=Stylosanthes scabra TaxID=79078 RepID=A0ABU6VGC1_9FABA|nr:hypothetical protein [Stylosanthes scabra]